MIGGIGRGRVIGPYNPFGPELDVMLAMMMSRENVAGPSDGGQDITFATTNPTLRRAVLRPMHSGNAFEETLERILQAIKLGVVHPGERLPSERELSLQLNVSRMTLREALRSLQESGYVESRPGRSGGTFVLRRPCATDVDTRTPRSKEAVQDVLDLRRIVERGACEYAANAKLSGTERALLRTTLADCSAASPEEYRALDSRLHLTIAEMSHVPSLAALAADARERLNDLLDSFPLLPPNVAHSNRQHVRIVNAILRGDAEAAVTEMERHIRGTASLITAFLT